MSQSKDEKGSEEEKELDVQISFRDLEKTMNIFNGDDTYPIKSLIDEFEDTARVMKWTKVEKLIYSKRPLGGTAKLFLRSWKNAFKEEFVPKINSAIIHKKLASRKMKSDETYQQYFLSIKESAHHGRVEDAALIEYVIDSIRVLYGASDIKEFRKKLDIYSAFRKKILNKPAQSGQSSGHHSTRKRCFNGGELDNRSPTCPTEIKCFKYNGL
ncbi:jg2919 [Pararge aegeria aegeria]|uniref:Jg2919 protein n=1 Tax=Pararge aegeria aegeria TaxID=348720 RepID=A0A8S4SET7_9NEOP|nr:jg2919 [Pararge aegeria aegeria]